VRQLAHAAGVSPTTVHLLETGQRMPQLLTAYKLCRALQVEPADIDEFRPLLAPNLSSSVPPSQSPERAPDDEEDPHT
jgi:DNA-binding XRE family transcriptional regulator